MVPRTTRAKAGIGPSVVTVACKVILWRSVNKIHGYPPGYKAKGKAPMANQVSVQLDSQDSILPA